MTETVLIVDDHPIVLHGLEQLFTRRTFCREIARDDREIRTRGARLFRRHAAAHADGIGRRADDFAPLFAFSDGDRFVSQTWMTVQADVDRKARDDEARYARRTFMR